MRQVNRAADHDRASGFRPPLAAVLGIDPEDTDPVRIILAAQLRLRQHRRDAGRGRGPAGRREVRRIVAARDTLLHDIVCDLTRRGLASLSARGQATDEQAADARDPTAP